MLAPGKHTLEFDFKYDGLGAATLQYGSPSGLGRSGTGYLKVDGKIVATKKMEKTVPMLMQWDENFDVGADTGSPVADEDYQHTLQVHRQARQADPDHRPAEALAGRHQEARDGHAQQPGERLAFSGAQKNRGGMNPPRN